MKLRSLHVQVGSPVIELFLKRDADGELQQQGTALSISPEVLSKMHSSLGKHDQAHCEHSF